MSLYDIYKEVYPPTRDELLASGKHLFIIWNPDYHTPPTVVFAKRVEAEDAAKVMAEKYAGEKFYVCKLESVSTAPRTVAIKEKLK